jgi:hypothetical protein
MLAPVAYRLFGGFILYFYKLQLYVNNAFIPRKKLYREVPVILKSLSELISFLQNVLIACYFYQRFAKKNGLPIFENVALPRLGIAQAVMDEIAPQKGISSQRVLHILSSEK